MHILQRRLQGKRASATAVVRQYAVACRTVAAGKASRMLWVGGICDLGQIDAYFTATLANREDSHAHGKSCMCLGAAAAINITEAKKIPNKK